MGSRRIQYGNPFRFIFSADAAAPSFEALRPEVQVDEDYEELSVPSEPPPLCARGNLLARARTVTEELITVNVDAAAGFGFNRVVVLFFDSPAAGMQSTMMGRKTLGFAIKEQLVNFYPSQEGK